jgi:hypothetical protein
VELDSNSNNMFKKTAAHVVEALAAAGGVLAFPKAGTPGFQGRYMHMDPGALYNPSAVTPLVPYATFTAGYGYFKSIISKRRREEKAAIEAWEAEHATSLSGHLGNPFTGGAGASQGRGTTKALGIAVAAAAAAHPAREMSSFEELLAEEADANDFQTEE